MLEVKIVVEIRKLYVFVVSFVWFNVYISFYLQAGDLHPRFNKLVNKYQTLQNYFAQSVVDVISKNLDDNSMQKQRVSFDIGYFSDVKYTYFEKSHIKMIDSEQNIEIISDGKNIYKYITPLNQYTKISLKDKSAIFDNINELSLNLIFAPERIFNDVPGKLKVRDLQYKLFENYDAEILYIIGKKEKELFFLILYIQKGSGLLYKWVLKTIHIHGKNRIANILRGRYYNIKYNTQNGNMKKLFEFRPPEGAQLVDEFDVAKYYEGVHAKLNSFVGQKLQIPQIKPINYTQESLNLHLKYVLIEVWATWCKICKSEIPFLNELVRKYKDKLEIIAISFEKESTLKKFINALSNKIEYNVANYDIKDAVDPYKMVVQYPSAFLLDNNFTLKKVWVGEKDRGKVIKYFEKLFGSGK